MALLSECYLAAMEICRRSDTKIEVLNGKEIIFAQNRIQQKKMSKEASRLGFAIGNFFEIKERGFLFQPGLKSV